MNILQASVEKTKDLEEHVIQLEEELKQLREHSSQMKDELKKRDENIEELQKEKDNMEKLKREWNGEKETWEKERQQLLETVNTKTEQYNLLETEKKEMELALQDTEEQLIAMEMDVLNEKKINGIQEKCEQYEEELKSKEKEIEMLRSEVQKRERELEE